MSLFRNHLFKIFSICIIALLMVQCQTPVKWPEENTDTKPGARWWWLGSAVDEKNLEINIQKYADAGLGSLEITPIYGVQGNDSNDVDFLSDKWMDLYKFTCSEASKYQMNIDMNTGTGWPFGGPNVTINDAAGKLLIEQYQLKTNQVLKELIEPKDEKQKESAHLASLMAYSNDGIRLDLTDKVTDKKLNWKAPKGHWTIIALFEGNTFQNVKRAAPGGEGLVMDHLNKNAVQKYLGKFTKAFEKSKAPLPHNFFNDSYEVFQADWSRGLLQAFEKQHGYRLQEYLPEFLSEDHNEITARIVSDYRETMSIMLLNNFTQPWTEWAHQLGSKTRNQAHGSPANLIDIYAAVDIPECEGFGLSDFNIKGLRKDSMTRHNYSDLSMLKYASSAAHITGKKFTSSETFTWLTEHFRTSFSQCKPDLDLMFISGVNHVYFHGTTYSPANDPWPGWKFYASVDMSPTNPLWRDAQPFFKYISRCQSFLQMGEADNDFLVYLPVYDMWRNEDGRYLMFDIHKMKERAPEFINAINQINNAGYDTDYISDKYLATSSSSQGAIVTESGAQYKAIIVPNVSVMPIESLKKILLLAHNGATVIFMDKYPDDVPGFFEFEKRKNQLSDLTSSLNQGAFSSTHKDIVGNGKIITGTNYTEVLREAGYVPEELKTKAHLQCIRRKNKEGYHYFISALKAEDTDTWVSLSHPAKSVVLFNPLNGKIGAAQLAQEDGKTKVRIALKSGQSVILKAYDTENINCQPWPYFSASGEAFSLNNNWKLYFSNSIPAINDTFKLLKLMPWTSIPVKEATINMGSAVYTTTFTFDKKQSEGWLLDLGDVRETARVSINGVYVQTLWSVPYTLLIEDYLKNGLNTITIEVTGLPANHIALLDRQKVPWRKFKEINLVDLNYSRTTYENWETMPCGLNSDVKIIPVNY